MDHLDAGAVSREESSTLFSLLLIFLLHLLEVLPEAGHLARYTFGLTVYVYSYIVVHTSEKIRK